MSESENDYQRGDEEDIDPGAHKKLLKAIGQLGKNQHIRKPTRTEPALARDEFHLVKPLSTELQNVSMGDVVRLLKKTSKHVETGRQLSRQQSQKKVLKKPLERPVAERIQRTLGYEKAKQKLSRWDAVIESNRVAEQQVFPLGYEEIHVDLPIPKKPRPTSIKSDLMLEMEAVENKLRTLKGVPQSNYDEDEAKLQQQMTREELIARRKELAYMRIKESQKSSKARLQNKIKSKKYHKLMKREKLKEQIKEFELLQKVNPEAALEKLESIEKHRVLERANLRHKNTGTWAKNLQIRAKYDKDVRKDLAEQLALSRELTQKQQSDEEASENDDDGETEYDGRGDESKDPFNPWFKAGKKVDQNDEVAEYMSGYRKYWMERNKNEKALKEYRDGDEDNENDVQVNGEAAKNGKIQDNNKDAEDSVLSPSSESDDNHSETELENFKAILNNSSKKNPKSSKTPQKTHKTSANISTPTTPRKRKNSTNESSLLTATPRSKKKQKITTSMNGSDWIVEDIADTTTEALDIDDIFDDAETQLRTKVKRKISALSDDLKSSAKQKRQTKKKSKQKSKSTDLSFKVTPSRPELDEELMETPANEDAPVGKQNPYRLADSKVTTTASDGYANQTEIDPSNVAQIKPKMLRTTLPDMVNSAEFFDEEQATEKAQMTIAEAFEDDDIVADFEKDRDAERKKTANEDVDLTLPGWGSWAGSGISKQKHTKRLILKFPKDAPRRDDNKQNVYINEQGNEKVKQHQVSDLPFPFKSVQEYEASIRAPIGRNFVPETAFRMLTRPATITKLGNVIEPMNDEILMKKPMRPRTVVDKRIAAMGKNKEKSK